jgi:hypothetical protein
MGIKKLLVGDQQYRVEIHGVWLRERLNRSDLSCAPQVAAVGKKGTLNK